MTDRELLELAAKAAGIRIAEWVHDGNGVDVAIIICGEGWGRERPWQPLLENQMTDADGDALRLAVKLRINIEHAETLGRKSHGVNCWPVGRGDCGHMENDLRDYEAATRRAIVRAAAEIGKEADK